MLHACERVREGASRTHCNRCLVLFSHPDVLLSISNFSLTFSHHFAFQRTPQGQWRVECFVSLIRSFLGRTPAHCPLQSSMSASPPPSPFSLILYFEVSRASLIPPLCASVCGRARWLLVGVFRNRHARLMCLQLTSLTSYFFSVFVY